MASIITPKTEPSSSEQRVDLQSIKDEISITAHDALKELQEGKINYTECKDRIGSQFHKISDRLPQLGKYFRSNYITLSADGVQTLLSDALEKGESKRTSHVALNKSSLIEYLQAFEKNQEQNETFIAFNFWPGSHYTPIYVKKENGKIQVLVTDSIQQTLAKKTIMDALQSAFSENQTVIYTYYIVRQSTVMDCDIFTIRDIRTMSKNSNLFNELDQLNESFVTSSHNFTFIPCYLMPPEFMKVTNSYKTIQDYIKSMETQNLHNKESRMEKLQNSLKKHQVNVCSSKNFRQATHITQNWWVLHHAPHYHQRLITLVKLPQSS